MKIYEVTKDDKTTDTYILEVSGNVNKYYLLEQDNSPKLSRVDSIETLINYFKNFNMNIKEKSNLSNYSNNLISNIKKIKNISKYVHIKKRDKGFIIKLQDLRYIKINTRDTIIKPIELNSISRNVVVLNRLYDIPEGIKTKIKVENINGIEIEYEDIDLENKKHKVLRKVR